MGWPAITATVSLLVLTIIRTFVPPPGLRHLPRAPIIPLLYSYLTGEAEDRRIKRLIIPFANEKKDGVVLVYAFGRWIVHVVDHKVR